MSFNRTAAHVAAACAVCVSASHIAAAQNANSGSEGGLEEVVVTAEKVETNLQDTPVSVATVSGEELTSRPTADLQSALTGIPGVQVSVQSNIGYTAVVRGIGPGILNGQQGVSTLFDGVYSGANISSRVGYFDVSRIEVLLGPQGTLYGRNAEGGVLNLVTNDPQSTFGASGSVGLGNYNALNVQAMVNLPISDTLSLRAAGSTNQQDGYLSNGQDDNHSTGGRVKLLYKPSDAFSVLFAGETTKLTGQGLSTVPGFSELSSSEAYQVPYPNGQLYEQDGYRTWAKIDADVGVGTLTVMPAYASLDEARQLTYNSTLTYSPGDGESTERSLEIRLASKPASRIGWIIGAYGFKSRAFNPGDSFQTALSSDGETIVRANTVASVTEGTVKSTGYFGQVTVPLGNRFRLIGGVRKSDDKATQFDDGASGNPAENAKGDWSHTDWRAGLQFDVADASMLYATIATGYRPGGFSPAPPYPAYDIEKVTSYEVGSKNEFLDHRLRLNVDAYYYDYQGFQQVTFLPCAFAGQPNPFNFPICTNPTIPINLAIQNVDKVSVKGLELNTEYALTNADFLSVAMAYSRSSIDSAFSAGLPPVSVEGQSLPLSPRWQGDATYRHVFAVGSGKLTPQLTLVYQGSQTLALPETPINLQGSVLREDLSVSYAPDEGKWRLNFWSRNLSNEVVKTSSDGRNVNVAPPRMYGATFSVSL